MKILVDIYIKEIRSILELAVTVWHSGLTLKQSNAIERIQRIAVSIICNDQKLSFNVCSTILNTEPLFL